MRFQLSKFRWSIVNHCLRCNVYTMHVQSRQFRLQHTAFKNDTSNMSKQSYWEEFYRKKQAQTSEGAYDWFFPYKVARPWLHHYIKQQAINTRDQDGQWALRVMDLGCGTSDLSIHLFADNPSLKISCIDFSGEAILKMQTTFGHLQPKEGHNPGITFVQGDAMCLPFADKSFHICYEKGTIDAILKQRTHGTSKAVGAICEMARVMTPSGVLMQFSDDPPELRLPLLEMAKEELVMSQKKSVSISFKEVSDFSGIEFFLYVMQDSQSVSI